MKQSFLIAVALFCSFASCGQADSQKTKVKNSAARIGGACEGCEAIYESPTPLNDLASADTLPDFNEPGPKLEISGVVYKPDGKTPAADVIIYVYHTDQKGNYARKGNETGWGKRHGYIRGWIKTDRNGYYRFYTLRPVSYPDSRNPQHIHIIVKEPEKNEYWIDEYLFDDDPFLTNDLRKQQEKRGGSGIIQLLNDKGRLHGKRDIILGKNIPGYPME